MKSEILKLKETVNTLTTSRPDTSNAFQEQVFIAKSPLEQLLSSPNTSRGSHHQITSPPTSKFYYKTPASWNPGAGRPNQQQLIGSYGMLQNGKQSIVSNIQNVGQNTRKPGDQLLPKNNYFFTSPPKNTQTRLFQ